jgi:hypothetical protein
VYWNFGQGNSYSPQHKHSPVVPALPPKVLSGGASSPRTTTPPIPPVPSNYRSQIPTPPPLPPPPCSNNDLDPLISELGNMGFSRAQAIDALEKNDHDLIKATHFLLDQAG